MSQANDPGFEPPHRQRQISRPRSSRTRSSMHLSLQQLVPSGHDESSSEHAARSQKPPLLHPNSATGQTSSLHRMIRHLPLPPQVIPGGQSFTESQPSMTHPPTGSQSAAAGQRLPALQGLQTPPGAFLQVAPSPALEQSLLRTHWPNGRPAYGSDASLTKSLPEESGSSARSTVSSASAMSTVSSGCARSAESGFSSGPPLSVNLSSGAITVSSATSPESAGTLSPVCGSSARCRSLRAATSVAASESEEPLPSVSEQPNSEKRTSTTSNSETVLRLEIIFILYCPSPE